MQGNEVWRRNRNAGRRRRGIAVFMRGRAWYNAPVPAVAQPPLRAVMPGGDGRHSGADRRSPIGASTGGKSASAEERRLGPLTVWTRAGGTKPGRRGSGHRRCRRSGKMLAS